MTAFVLLFTLFSAAAPGASKDSPPLSVFKAFRAAKVGNKNYVNTEGLMCMKYGWTYYCDFTDVTRRDHTKGVNLMDDQARDLYKALVKLGLKPYDDAVSAIFVRCRYNAKNEQQTKCSAY